MRSLYAKLKPQQNLAITPARSLNDLTTERWYVVGDRGFLDETWAYVPGIEGQLKAFETLRSNNMLILTQRRDEGVFTLLAKVANTEARTWPSMLRTELARIRP